MRGGERGQVAGVETLAIGTLVFVVGTLIAVNTWSVVTTKAAVDDLATTYLRAYTEAPDPRTAHRDGLAALDVTGRSHGLEPGEVEVVEPAAFSPCAVVDVRVSVEVPLVRLPLVGSVGSTRVDAVRSERIDPYRSGAAAVPADPDGAVSPCAG